MPKAEAELAREPDGLGERFVPYTDPLPKHDSSAMLGPIKRLQDAGLITYRLRARAFAGLFTVAKEGSS
eukprot:11217581-Lingulodinium_polyedra.AAC.1